MYQKQQPVSAERSVVALLILVSAIALKEGLVVSPNWYLLLWITLPLLGIFAYTARK